MRSQGYVKVQYYIDEIRDGVLKSVKVKQPLGLVIGPTKITKRQAEALRAEHMEAVNRTRLMPQSAISVAQYVKEYFIPDHVDIAKKSTARYYRDRLKVILPAIGKMAIRDVTRHHAQAILNDLAAKGQSANTILNTRRAVSVIFNLAEDSNHFQGKNPATRAKVPASAKEPQEITGYRVDEMHGILSALDSPLREMAALGASTSIHGSELRGLKIDHVNLSDQPRTIAGKVVRPGALIVTRGKSKYRVRVLPIPDFLHGDLLRLAAGRDREAPLFTMPHGRGRPVEMGNITSRVFAPLSRKLGIKVNWHRFRHTNATWTDELLLEPIDRAAMMGHSSVRTTDTYYTDQFERQKRAANAIGARLMGKVDDDPIH